MTRAAVTILWLVLAASTGATAHEPPPAGAAAACSCAVARLADGFCSHCRVGWVAGVRIRSEIVFHAIDAHGHAIDAIKYGCESCLGARATDGYCESCGIGWVKGLGYFSRLTYHLAKGERTDPARIACPVCRGHAGSHGWCEKCGVGMLGPVRVRSRADFDEAAKAYRQLLRANEEAARCEGCAAALAANGRCPIHATWYRDGERVSPPASGP